MDLKKIKWISALFSALLIGVFEFVRHQFLDIVSMDWGNVLVAGLTGILFVVYFHGIFAVMESIQRKLQKEKEEASVLQERDRIARELHDSVAQALFFLNIKITEIETALQERRDPSVQASELKEAIKLTDADVRRHIFVLQKVNVDNVDLPVAIRAHLDTHAKQSGIKVSLTIDGDVNARLSNQEKNHLLRIFQEVLLNIRKHAEADKVNVRLAENGKHFSMVICDDGKGFDINDLRTKQSSFGLKILKDDARLIHANFVLDSLPGKGTTVTIQVNLRQECTH
jgi:signal transduction histidine kinase